MRRSTGIILPIFALPSKYGIGTFGRSAYEFINFLAEAGQSWWQILPVGPTSYGDSPYQSFSTFAGNPYFIDLDILINEGLLKKEEVEAHEWGNDPEHVDYEKIYYNRFEVLKIASVRGWKRDCREVEEFIEENKTWILSYGLFMALKRHFAMKPWTQWEDMDIRLHKPEAIEKYSNLLKDDIKMFYYIQFLFYKQWNDLRAYARQKNIGIIGDLPIYVAMDSADVWSEPYWFQLDSENRPYNIAGVPPDSFTADGQLWGNPLYNWERMKEDGYSWWIRRIGGAAKLYDVIRFDHFRGLESYWAVPANDVTAINGHWVKGPGMDLLGRLLGWFQDVQFIAEDLGYLTPEVRQLLADSKLPGMKILEFAFDSREESDYLPHTYNRHSVCYVGTHDNATCAQWKDEAAKEDVQMAKEYLGLNEEEGFVWGMIRGGMSSVADLFMVQMQDYLELGKEARINRPGSLGGNWQWRMLPGKTDKKLAGKIAKMTRMYGRSRC